MLADNFYKVEQDVLYKNNFVPVSLMTLSQLDSIVVNSLFSRDTIIEKWLQDDIRAEKARKRGLKLIALIAVMAVASAAVATSGTSAASAGALSAETGMALPAATEMATIGSAAIPEIIVTPGVAASATLPEIVVSAGSASAKAGTLLTKIQATAKYVGGIASTVAQVTGSETAARIAETAGMLGSGDLDQVVMNAATDLLKEEKLELDENGNIALQERLRREQEIYANYMARQATFIDDKETQAVQPKKEVDIGNVIMLATPFLLYFMGG